MMLSEFTLIFMQIRKHTNTDMLTKNRSTTSQEEKEEKNIHLIKRKLFKHLLGTWTQQILWPLEVYRTLPRVYGRDGKSHHQY